MGRVLSNIEKIREIILLLYREALKFGVVGLVGVVIDFSINYWALHDEEHSMFYGSDVKAKIFSGVVATLFSWFANRYWTFKHRQTSRPWREFILFLIMNGIGIFIASACVWFSKYVLNLESAQASLIAGQVVGLGLGTIFRFVAYRFLVFKEKLDEDPDFDSDDEAVELAPR